MEGAGVSAKLKRAYGLHIGVLEKGRYFFVCNFFLQIESYVMETGWRHNFIFDDGSFISGRGGIKAREV